MGDPKNINYCWFSAILFFIAASCVVCFTGCSRKGSASEVFHDLTGLQLSTNAQIRAWKIKPSIGELRALFLITLLPHDLDQVIPITKFTRNQNEEGADFVQFYNEVISEQVGLKPLIPTNSMHLVGKIPNRIIHAFWEESTANLVVYVCPGPAVPIQ